MGAIICGLVSAGLVSLIVYLINRGNKGLSSKCDPTIIKYEEYIRKLENRKSKK